MAEEDFATSARQVLLSGLTVVDRGRDREIRCRASGRFQVGEDPFWRLPQHVAVVRPEVLDGPSLAAYEGGPEPDVFLVQCAGVYGNTFFTDDGTGGLYDLLDVWGGIVRNDRISLWRNDPMEGTMLPTYTESTENGRYQPVYVPDDVWPLVTDGTL